MTLMFFSAHGLFSRGHSWLGALRRARQIKRDRTRFITEAIEAFVTDVEPRLRAIHAYERRLWPVMTATLDYLDVLAGELPQAFTLSRRDWLQHPHTNAFFASPSALTKFLADSDALGDFFRVIPTPMTPMASWWFLARGSGC